MAHLQQKDRRAGRSAIRNWRWLSLSLVSLVLSACGTLSPPPPPPPPPPMDLGQGVDLSQIKPDWRSHIQSQDLQSYQRLDEAWTTALQQARSRPGSGDLASLGSLLDPRVRLDFVTPPPGAYRCRTIKLGSQSPERRLGYVIYGWFACNIVNTDAGLKLTKLRGSQNPSGLLFPENDSRMIFLGSLSSTGEPAATSYGQNPERDMVSVFERIGDRRWRLATPYPQAESVLDLLELVPAPAQRR